METKPHITHATPADCEALAAFAAESFSDTFGHLYAPQDLAVHLAAHSSPEAFRAALVNGDIVLLLCEQERIIAYAKAGAVGLPVDSIPEGAQEIHRLYVHRDYQGRGLGRRMMEHLLALPAFVQAPALYLGVWEENFVAQALYRRYGFQQIGTYLYHVGAQADRELILMHPRAGA